MAHRNKLIFVVSVLVVALVLAGTVLVNDNGKPGQAGQEKTTPIEMPPPPVIGAADIVTLLAPDSIRAIDEPKFETAEAANDSLDGDERVIILMNYYPARD